MTTTRTAYTFAILRYSHDVVAGEFLNLGVVVLGASPRRCVTRMAESFMRLTLAFPACNTIDVKKQVDRIQDALHHAAAETDSLQTVLSRVLPDEQGSFHWSDVGAGVCSNLEDAARELFERFVADSNAKYGELEDLFGVANTLFEVRREQPARWVSLPACNDEYGAMAIAAGGSS